MNDEIQFLTSGDSRVTELQLKQALQIAEDVFQTATGSSHIEIGDENVQWTTKNLPECWILILSGNDCIGSVAVLPSTSEKMNSFFSGKIDESELMHFAKTKITSVQTFDCLYLSGVTIRSDFQKRGIGTSALIHAIAAAQVALPNAKTLFTWTYTDAGGKLIRKIQENYEIRIRS
ncbi:MAG: N-acetyltransferase [Proteobacteria bacterium]|nr:MAG: N-acetyltransferase [Pseudomonadota bacterium]